ncbi:hypothetical protein MTO96_025032 [Rhipicephalus appendiculatus]
MPSAAVHRADSTRSDNSDASGRSAESRGSAGKKVSFSRAVRVKKFPRRHEGSSNSVAHAGNGDVVDSAQVPPSPEKKFWFKVYKNRHHHDKTAGGSRVAEEQPLPVETTVSDSSGHHHHHHARGTSSVARSASSASASRSPRRRPDSPVVKRNHVRRIVQKFDREATLRHDLPASSSRESSPPPPPIPPPPSVVRSYSVEEYTRPGTPIELQRSPAPKRSNRLVDGVKVILAPLTRKKSSASKKEARSAGTGTLVREEDFEEVNNNENKENEPVEEEEEMPVMVDKATQVKPFDLEEFFATSGDVSHLYSQVDKSKKTTTFKTPEIHVHHPEVVVDYPITSSPRYVDDRDYEYYERSRASSSSPTLRRGGDGRWEHDDKRRDSDTSSINSEPGILSRDGGSRPGSVLKAYDSKKRELSYENVPARVSETERSRTGSPTTSTSGVWVRDIDKDYRRGMADADVTVPSSGYVFTYTASLGGDRSSKKKTTKSGSRDASPTLLDNGSLSRTHRRSPSRGPRSVSSDQTSVRGGLAAAYQARQARAAASSSNGRVSKSSSPRSPRVQASPGRSSGVVSGSVPGSAQGSVAGSVISEPAYQRDTVVLYIPGVSHHATPSESSLRVSRSQSVLNKESKSSSSSRSASKSGHKSKSSSSRQPKRAASESDIRRTKSIPKGAKFPWLRIKPTVTATPVH